MGVASTAGLLGGRTRDKKSVRPIRASRGPTLPPRLLTLIRKGRSPASSLVNKKGNRTHLRCRRRAGRRRSDHKEISPLCFDFFGKPRFAAGEKIRALVIQLEHPHDDSKNHVDRMNKPGEMLAAGKIETCRR